MTRYSSLLLSFILMALPLQADDDIFNMGLQKELAVKIGANPFHWDGKITVGEFDLITGIFTRGERLYFVSGSGAYAPIAGVAWNTSRNDEHVAAFVGAIQHHGKCFGFFRFRLRFSACVAVKLKIPGVQQFNDIPIVDNQTL